MHAQQGRETLVRASGDEGANLVEYAMLISFIFLIALVSVKFFAGESASKFYEACDAIVSAGEPTPEECG